MSGTVIYLPNWLILLVLMYTVETWKRCACHSSANYKMKVNSQVKLILPQHQTRRTKMSVANSQDLSSALTEIYGNVEGLTAVSTGHKFN